MALGGGGIDTGGIGMSQMAVPRLSPEYYTQWRRDTAEKIARGEDPYADFAQRARERSDSNWLRKVVNKVERVLERKRKEGKDVRNMKGEEVIKIADEEESDDEDEGNASTSNGKGKVKVESRS